MPEPVWLFMAVVALAAGFAFINGWSDAANAAATALPTRVLAPFGAAAWGGLLNLAGALASVELARTIAGGIVHPASVSQLAVVAALAGAVLWCGAMVFLALPVSATHALVGAILGAGIAEGGVGVVNGAGFAVIIGSLLAFPGVALVLGFGLAALLVRVAHRGTAGAVRRWLRRLQFLSASLAALAHGAADGPKAAGVIVLGLVAGGYQGGLDGPAWTRVVAGVGLGAGTALGGWHLARTRGVRFLRLDPLHAVAAESGAGVVTLLTAAAGWPVSTTHVLAATVVGSGTSRGVSMVRWGIAGRVAYAWLFTLPGAAAVAYLTFFLLRTAV